MYIAAGDSAFNLIWLLVVGVVVVVSRIVEYLRKQQEAQKKSAARNAQHSPDTPEAATPAPRAGGLEALLQALEQGSAPIGSRSAEAEPTRSERDERHTFGSHEERDDREDLEDREYARDVERTEGARDIASPYRAESAQPPARARVLRDEEKMRRAQERIELANRKAREAARDATLSAGMGAGMSAGTDAVEIASQTPSTEPTPPVPHAKQAMKASLTSAFAAKDLKAGFIWATALGAPRGASEYGAGQMGAPPGLS
jgi:hypothetical protein